MNTQHLRAAISHDLLGIHHLGNLMPEHLLHHKEVTRIMVLLRLISKHMAELEYLEHDSAERKNNLELYL